ncbi:MAG TPA: hypothetical protein VGQ67_14600 [Candidatus Polarisedimenticolia bacterium]|jgi:photosystem II stability/assembly factor-like uncharacterized protein|nr:hypothetical protein [Candidatus Polarisedimenticolia bacterium]
MSFEVGRTPHVRRSSGASRLARATALLLVTAVLLAAKKGDKPESSARPLTADDFKGLSFRSIGPSNMGGRASAIALVPGSRTSFYAGFGTGGVFKTENLGVTFTPVFDDQPNLSIGALAVADAPADWPGWAEEDKTASEKEKSKDRVERGRGRIVWVGTGEGNGRNSSSWGNGVYRSTDGGSSFKHLGLEETHDIPRIALDPRHPDVAYVAALGHLWGANPERGVFKTTDGGATWKQVLKIDADTGACDVVVDPKAPETVYAGMYARRRTPWSFTGNSDKGGIFRSTNGGGTWTKLTQGLPPRTGRIGLSLFAKNPRILYAVVESDYGGTGKDSFDNYSKSGGLFRSEDGGDHFTRVSPVLFRPFYFSRVAVDPENDQRVYMPGWDLAISDDGGKTFRKSGSPKVHVDFHAIVVNPLDPNQIIVGNDGGLYLSHDRAKNWDYLNTIAVGQFYRIALDDSDPYRVAGGLQDNGSWMGPSETLWESEDEGGGDTKDDGITSSDWISIFGSDGFTVQFDPTDRNLVYATGQGASIGRIRLDNNVRTAIAPAPGEGQERIRYNWNAPYFVSPHDPSVLYLGGNKVFKLADRGDHWFAISPDLSKSDAVKTSTVGSAAETYGTVVSLAESPMVKGMLWAGTDDGRVHVTKNDGGAWADVTPKEAGGLYVSRIFPSQHQQDTAYVAVDGHRSDDFRTLLFMTEDAGKSWKSLAGDLPPKEPVEVVIEARLNKETLYAGTQFGLYVTVDRGGHWVRINGKSLPPAPIGDLQIHPRERDLVVATHGRSIYVLDDVTPIAQLTPEVRDKRLYLFEPMPATPRLYAGRNYGGGAGIFRAPNPPMGAAITYWLRDGNPDGVKLRISDASGATLRELSGPGRPGLNRVTWDLQADAKDRIASVDSNRLGQTQFVPAGDYTVSASLDTGTPGRPEKMERKVKVKPAPGAPAPQH